MKDDLDSCCAAIERRLERLSVEPPSPALRLRVLTAIDDLLSEKVPATKSGQFVRKDCLACPDLVAGTFFVGVTAAALSFILMVPSIAGFTATHRAAWSPLVERLRLCGMADDDLLALVAAPPHDHGPRSRHHPDLTATSRPPLPFIKARRLLEENL